MIMYEMSHSEVWSQNKLYICMLHVHNKKAAFLGMKTLKPDIYKSTLFSEAHQYFENLFCLA
jgi:hypothetical protein